VTEELHSDRGSGSEPRLGVQTRTLAIALLAVSSSVFLGWLLTNPDEARGGFVPVRPHPSGASELETVADLASPTVLSDASDAHGARTSVPVIEATPSASVDAPEPAEAPPVEFEVRFHEQGAPAVPVPGVTCRLTDRAGAVRSATSDDEGLVMFAGVAPGNVTLATSFDTSRFRLAPGRSRGNVPVPPPLTVEGRVVDSTGRVVPGAEILSSYISDPNDFVLESVSDASGRFRLESVRSRSYLQARKEGHCRSPGCMVDESLSRGELVLTLLAARDYSGIVLDGLERPVAGARVQVGSGNQVLGPNGPTERGRRFPTLWEGLTDEHGRFIVLDVHEDDALTVTVRKNGFATAVVDPVLDPHALVIRLESEASIRGRVTDADGRGLEGALVRWGGFQDAESATGTSDADGRFRLHGVPLQPVVHLRVVHPLCAPREVDVRLPREGEELVLVLARR